MADTKISALTQVTSPALDAQEIPCNDAGTTKKIVLGTDLKPWIGVMIGNRSVSDQVITGATTVYVTNSHLAVPVGKLRAGTAFRWSVFMSKSAAGTTAGSTLLLKIGTLGTTGDATIATLTTGTPTAVADTAQLELQAIIRTIGASATSEFAGSLRHNLAATGFSNIAGECYATTGAAFDSTVANLIVGLTFTVTAASVWTVRQVLAEAEAL